MTLSRRCRIYTVGHSSRSFDGFAELLCDNNIELLVDIRRFPASRKFPWFNRDELQKLLAGHGIDYRWKEALGGRRHSKNKADSPNKGLKSAGFRNYADYMLTEDFISSANDLIDTAKKVTTAVMCAEKMYFKCHRRILSDWLCANGLKVIHIIEPGSTKTHRLSENAQAHDGRVIYPKKQNDQPYLF